MTETATAAVPTLEARSPAAMFDRGLRLALVLCLLGFLLGLALLPIDEDRMRYWHMLMTVAMYRSQDTVWLGLGVGACLALYWSARSQTLARAFAWTAAFWPARPRPVAYAAIIALVVLAFVGAGTYLFTHAYGLVLDEFMGEIQADIFRSGRLLVRYPGEWGEYVRALFPAFLFQDVDNQLWGSGYRPVFAAIRALFSLAGLGPLTNAILTALSVVLIADIARKLWPDRGDAAVLAAVLLATGPQFLITGMTGFAWPAHLCLNLLWLRLYLRDDTLGHGLAALVGFAAVGLHQINPHPFFVLPFMLALLGARRWRLAGFYACTYSAALVTWIFWTDIAVYLTADQSSAETGPATTVGVGYVANAISLINADRFFGLPLIVVNLLRLMAWQNLAVLPLIVVALRPWKAAPPIVRLLAWSCVLSMIPYVLVMPNQMYAWGYRYMHGLLGNMALIAVYGWIRLSAQGGLAPVAAKRAIVALTLAVIVVGMPLRSAQLERYVAPMAAANRFIHSLPSDIVLVDIARIWFRTGTIRNDPFLESRPLVLSMRYLTPDLLARICQRYSVTYVDYDDLAPFGVMGVETHFAEGKDLSGHDWTMRSMVEGPACRAGDPTAGG